MNIQALNNPDMKKEAVIAYAGTVLLALAFVFKNEMVKDSSPLALFILAVAGLLLSWKCRLVGGTLLFFSGLALAIHPLKFASSLLLVHGAILVSLAGFIYLINWWKENGETKEK